MSVPSADKTAKSNMTLGDVLRMPPVERKEFLKLQSPAFRKSLKEKLKAQADHLANTAAAIDKMGDSLEKIKDITKPMAEFAEAALRAQDRVKKESWFSRLFK